MNPARSRYLPFAIFIAFIALEQSVLFLRDRGVIGIDPIHLYYLYPVRAIAVAGLLFRYRREYCELALKDLLNYPTTIWVSVIGLLVFLLWIKMDWTFPAAGPPRGYNLLLLPEGPIRAITGLFRFFGAVLVVPVMEELFWRSFLIRYIVHEHFETIPLGTFTWPSFLTTVLLFGLEHDNAVAGMMAGLAYNLILYRTRSLTHCVLAHTITNLALSVYVLSTGNWQFW